MSADLLFQLQEALADTYTIERALGHGGMATVFLARERRHDRPVAIKVMDPELGAAIGAPRFLREIEVAARLTHPNILSLYDSGEAARLLYYVMPYVAGESLKTRLERGTELSIDEAVDITRQIAGALAYAHAAGVVHRDIKPANILLDSGRALLADFGIARATTAADQEKLTRTGVMLGTPGYMSPEQIAGDREIDGRSDLYSLACVLYEMLAGQPPFTGRNTQAIAARHLLDPVPRLRTLRPAVTPALERAIERALEKSPTDRFAKVDDFAEALEGAQSEASAPHTAGAAWGRGSARPTRRRRTLLILGALAALVAAAALGWYVVAARASESDSRRVAVAPFEDRTGSPQLAQLGDLAADWVTRSVARSQSVEIAPASIAREAWLSTRNTPERRIGVVVERTGADVIVVGSYTADAGSVWFAAEIIDARTGRLITDVAPVAGNAGAPATIVARLAERIEGALVPRLNRTSTLVTSNPPSLEAFRSYQTGLEAFSRGEWAQSLPHFQRAIAIDSTYPPPVVWAATALTNLGRLAAADSIPAPIEPVVNRLTPIERVNYEWQRAILRGDRQAQ